MQCSISSVSRLLLVAGYKSLIYTREWNTAAVTVAIVMFNDLSVTQ